MADLKQQLKEDKAIRSAARSILSAQVEQVRQGFSGRRLGEKFADRVGDPALEKLQNMGTPTKIVAAAVAGAAGVLAAALALKPVAGLLKANSDSPAVETDDDA